MKRKPLRIGNLIFEYPFVLAPLAGITDRSMRSLCCEAGASLTYTEMVSAKGLWYGDRKTTELLTIGPEEGPVGYQLFGHEPIVLAHAVRALEEVPDPEVEKLAGAPEEKGENTSCSQKSLDTGLSSLVPGPPSLVPGPPPKPWPGYANDRRPVLYDLNAGCPVPKIVRNGEGSALLQDPDLLYDCVSAMCDASKAAAKMQDASASEAAEDGKPAGVNAGDGKSAGPKPVTVKFRKGFHRGENMAVEIAKAAEAAGAAAITVHGRTREQYYEGKADWDVIAEVKSAVRIPVIGNGDVHSGADAIRMMEETGCDGVMIARGAMGNPWIFQQARALWTGQPLHEPAVPERIEMLLKHIDMVCEDKGERMGVREMRKHIAWYTKGIRGAAQIRRQANSIDSAEELKQVLSQLL